MFDEKIYVMVVIWNYGYPGALPVYDIRMAVILKHMFDLNYFN